MTLNNRPTKKRVPLGKPLQLNKTDLDRMSKVVPEDIAKALAFWRNHAPEKFKSLLDAK